MRYYKDFNDYTVIKNWGTCLPKTATSPGNRIVYVDPNVAYTSVQDLNGDSVATALPTLIDGVTRCYELAAQHLYIFTCTI